MIWHEFSTDFLQKQLQNHRKNRKNQKSFFFNIRNHYYLQQPKHRIGSKTSVKVHSKKLFRVWANSIAQGQLLVQTSEIYDEKSGISWIFRNPPNFEESEKIFLLNRFLKFRIYFEAMDLNRSFLQSQLRSSRLAYPPSPASGEDFRKMAFTALLTSTDKY